MRILAAKDAVEFIREHGGELFVWADLTQCPGCSLPFLAASTERPQGEREFSLKGSKTLAQSPPLHLATPEPMESASAAARNR